MHQCCWSIRAGSNLGGVVNHWASKGAGKASDQKQPEQQAQGIVQSMAEVMVLMDEFAGDRKRMAGNMISGRGARWRRCSQSTQAMMGRR
ncbi:MAG: hypothetical protein HC898_08085 [Phycisphaerales bacterium]|nr:hypothetical protein [Phycisphaerales bacterium]